MDAATTAGTLGRAKRRRRVATVLRGSAPWTLASVLTAGIVLAIVGRLHEAFGDGVPVGKVVLALGYLAMLTGPTVAVVRRALNTAQGRAVVLFAAAHFVSLPFSLLRTETLDIATAFISRSVPFMVIMLLSVRSVADVSRMLRAMVILQILVGLLIVAGFGVVLVGADGPRTTLAGSYDPNDLALVMATCGAASLWAFRDRRLIWRIAGALGLALGIYVIIRTYSRGGALALAVMMIAVLLFAKQAVPRFVRLSIVPLLALAVFFAPAQYRDRLATLGEVSNDYNITDPSGRTQIWKRGLGYFISRPITGVGAGNFGFAEGKYGASIGKNAGWKWSAAHSMYIESLAELGLPGFLGVLGMLLPSIQLWFRVRRQADSPDNSVEYRRQVEAVAVAVIGFMAGAIFLNGTRSPMLILLATLGIALHGLSESVQLADRPTVAFGRRRRMGLSRGR